MKNITSLSFKNLSIKSRLTWAFGLVLGLIVFLGLFVSIQILKLGRITTQIYEHPLQVSNAALDANRGIIKMHRSMKDVALATDKTELNRAIGEVQKDEKEVFKHLDIVKSRILGVEGQQLEKEARRAVIGWRPIREEVIALVHAGKTRDAALITKHKGATYVTHLEEKMTRLMQYARRKANLFMAQTGELQKQTLQTLTISILGVGMLVFVFVWLTAKSIVRSFSAMKETLKTKVAYAELNQVLDTGVPLSVISKDLKIMRVNESFCAYFGTKEEEIADRNCYDVLPSPHCHTAECVMERMLVDKKRYDYEIDKKSDEGPAFFTVTAVPYWGNNGEFIGIIANYTDITARKRAEEERRKIEEKMQHVQKLESLGVLAGGIAHDFNNLLMSILGNADLALLELSPVSPVRDNIKNIEKASRRAAELCRQMLAYSGKGKFVIEELNLSEVIHETAHILEISISKKAVLKYNFADNLPFIEADATQIRQVVMNLITNASEAIGDKSGVISISTGAMFCDRAYLDELYGDEALREDYYAYVEIADTGCGMDEHTRTKLFDPFFTTKFTGRGLGMAAVLGIVRGHHGAIKIYSEPGKGTIFKLLFPVKEEKTAQGQGPGNAKEDIPWSGSGTILLVDDEETVCAVGKRMLEKVGFTALTAPDGREAVKIFREHADEIVCVLLDLTMPHMDGEEAFRELRRIKKDVRVIVSSGYNEQEVTQSFVGKGLAGFIQKPYQTAALIAKLREVLETK